MKHGDKDLLALLKGVSRSFYWSVRLLPGPMRRGVVIGYLLARASDTLADTVGVPVEVRLGCLSDFREGLAVGEVKMPESCLYEEALGDSEERVLLGRVPEVLRAWAGLPEAERGLVREVLEIIVGGQRLDLERFAGAGSGHPVALQSREELDDYTYRVAGCVGEFWTKLGFLTMGEGFSRADPQVLSAWGRDYGKGLQLVNILRDAPVDRKAGRCYLPVADVEDRAAFLCEHRYWQQMARVWVGRGLDYQEKLESRRLRIASGLPAAIGMETLDLLAAADWAALEARVKVSRRWVYGALLRGLVLG